MVLVKGVTVCAPLRYSTEFPMGKGWVRLSRGMQVFHCEKTATAERSRSECNAFPIAIRLADIV
jgi:hypothetical protein